METKKNPPVDRGKLLIGLDICGGGECDGCPYLAQHCKCSDLANDAYTYICYLEEQLGEALGHDA